LHQGNLQILFLYFGFARILFLIDMMSPL